MAADGRFNLFVPASLASNGRMIARLIRRYGLISRRVLVLADPHYDEPSRARQSRTVAFTRRVGFGTERELPIYSSPILLLSCGR